MDLLFQRYASPFILLNQYIKRRRLLNFIDELIKIKNDEEIYKIWLHRVHDKSYASFKGEIEDRQKANNFSEKDKLNTIQKSKEILESIKLEGS